MPASPEAFYRERLSDLEARHATAQRRHTVLLSALAASALAFAVLAIAALHRSLPLGAVAVPVAALAGLLLPFLRNRRALDRVARLDALYDAGLRRVTHEPAESPPDPFQTGEAFREPGHLFDRDLSILGPDSLIAALGTTRTGVGQRALAHTLLHPPPASGIPRRQAVIAGLAPLTGLREEIALLGPNAFASTHHETFDLWLDQPAVRFPTLLKPVLSLTSAIAVLLVIAWFSNHLALDSLIPNLAAVLGLQAAIALLYRSRALPILEATQPLPGQLQILRDGLKLIQTLPPEPARPLTTLQQEIAGADAAINDLQRQFFVIEQRKTEWFYLPALAFNLGTHAAIRIDRWKTEHGEPMRRWIAAWAEFDALNALAAYAFEHPGNTFPSLLDDTAGPTFRATGLTHPLLANAVANDVDLGPGTRFYLISGSNMAGKSTLLRAIGLAVVLARAGAPVPASACELTPLALGASLTPTDSLAEGKSRFLAEVERLQWIVALARESPALFLIDELFSGTNSADRLTAAAAVLEALLAAGTIGALSTHDLALTTLATQENHGRNVHMASPDPTDPLAFDYLLKPGVNTTTNALAFLRLLNL